MKSPRDDPHDVEDSEETVGKCICKLYPMLKNNKLADYAPDALFCVLGRSGIPTKIRMTKYY